MTRKDRVINALNHKESDIVPYHMDFTMQEFDIVSAYLNDNNFEDKLKLHLQYCQYWGWPTELKDKQEHFKDEFGVVWNRTGADKDIGVVDIPKIYEPNINLWEEPILDENRLRKEYQEIINSKNDKFKFAGIGFSMFERAWSLCGMENILIYMISEQDFTHKLLDKICDYNCKIINIANEYDFDGFYFGDDWGQQKGLIMGPVLWKKFIKPRMKKMYDLVKKNNRFVFQHSCGDIQEIFPDLIEIGLNCYQTFQPEIYNIENIKLKFGNDLTFWGGISTQQLLPYATPEKVKNETLRIMNIMSKNGGYIAAPTHAIPSDVPPENILAMLEAFNTKI